jgi:hypothetical protein
MRRTLLVGLAVALLVILPLGVASAGWSDPVLLDSRIPLEISQVRLEPPGDIVYVPVLFDLASNALDLARVNVSVSPPTATFIPIANGAIFALGAIGDTASAMGFSFIDGNFDLRFGNCQTPCDSVNNSLLNAGTWIDSASAASADDFFVAALDNNPTHSVTIFHSPDGALWNVLSTFTPPEAGGVYDNFHGGKRIGLVVDPTATNPADTLNCLLYEVKTSSTTTSLRINCRVGATPLAIGDEPDGGLHIYSDTPNPGGVFDRFIETVIAFLFSPGPQDPVVFGTFSGRQVGQVFVFGVDLPSQTPHGPVALGPSPPGPDFYSTSVAAVPNDGIHSFWSAAPNEPDHHVETPADPTDYQLHRPGPQGGGVVSGGYWETGDVDFWKILYIIVSGGGSRAEAPGAGGLAISIYPLPLFDDGVDTGDTIRWSAAVP